MEYLDIVDENDKVLGKAPKDDIYNKKLVHRIVHILVFNDQGEMALQLRSKTVKFCPSHWVTSVGGHVQSGETYEEAALREYKEELCATSKIEFFSKDFYGDDGGLKKFLVTFKTINNGPFDVEKRAVKSLFF